MEKEIKVGIHNCFDFIKRDANTGEVLGEYKAENIILNNFWAKFLSASGYDCLKYIHFGSGTATPVATDVKLTTWLGYKTAPSGSAGLYDFSTYYSDGIISIKKTVRLEDTEFTGNFISEVGYSSTTSGTTGLLTKALVKDMNGNVVSIEKKAGEILDIFATFYINFGTGFDGGNMYFSGNKLNAFNLFGKLLFYGSNSIATGNNVHYLQGRPQPQAGDQNAGALNAVANGQATGAFDVPNKKIIFTLPNLTSANGNIANGIRGLCVAGLLINLPCTGFSQPVLTKEVVGAGDGITRDFKTAFGYIKDNGTCKVYVNDVEVSATIDYQKPARTNLVNDMNILDYPRLGSDGTPRQTGSLGSPSVNSISGDTIIAENPFYNTVPIDSIGGYYVTTYASNDLENWTQVANGTSTTPITVSADYKNCRYWKFVCTWTSSYVASINTTPSINNIHIAVAPAAGSTVSVTYQPDCIAKDAQHVLNNVKVTLSFNEYAPT